MDTVDLVVARILTGHITCLKIIVYIDLGLKLYSGGLEVLK